MAGKSAFFVFLFLLCNPGRYGKNHFSSLRTGRYGKTNLYQGAMASKSAPHNSFFSSIPGRYGKKKCTRKKGQTKSTSRGPKPTPRVPQEDPKRTPREPERTPRGPKGTPRAPQEDRKRTSRKSKRLQEELVQEERRFPLTAASGFLGRYECWNAFVSYFFMLKRGKRPRGPQEHPKSDPRGPKSTPRGPKGTPRIP
jgi:hypothetical protein